MKCSYCKQVAQFKCVCELSYMCSIHFGSHFDSLPYHSFEKLEVELESSKFELVRLKLLKRVKKLTQAKNNVNKKARNLIDSIQSLGKKAIDLYDNLINTYTDLLQHEKFTQSELPIIDSIRLNKMKILKFSYEKIANEVEEIFSKDFVIFSRNYKYRKIEFLEKHAGGFTCGAVTGDYKTLVTGGFDSTIRVWNLEEQKQICVLYGHWSDVYCLALTTNSKHIISGSYDRTVRIWSLENKNKITILKGHKSIVLSVSYVNEGSLIISGGFDSEIIIWSFINKTIILIVNTESRVDSLLMMETQKTFIAGSNPDIIFYDLKTCKQIKVFNGHSNIVRCLTLTNDENILVSGSSDNLILIWDLRKSSELMRLQGHSGTVRSILLTMDELFIISGSDDNSIMVWSIMSGLRVQIYKNHTSSVFSIIKFKEKFLSLSEDSKIGELEVKKGSFLAKCFLKPFMAHGENFTDDFKLIAYGSENEAFIWDTELTEDKLAFSGHLKVLFVEVSNDEQFLLIGLAHQSNNLIYWNLKTNEMIAEFSEHKNIVCCASFSQDNLSAASGSLDFTVRLWDLKILKQEFIFIGHNNKIESIKFTKTSRMLASGGSDKKVIVWNLKDKTLYCIFDGHRLWIEKILITEDDFIISGDFADGIRIWNIHEKRQEFLFSSKDQAKDWLKAHNIKLELLKCFLKP